MTAAGWPTGKEEKNSCTLPTFFTMPMLQLTVIFLLLFLLFLLRLRSSVQPQHTANWIADTGAIDSLIHVHLCASCMFLRRRWECNAKNWTEVRKREKRDVDKWCIFIMLKVVSIVLFGVTTPIHDAHLGGCVVAHRCGASSATGWWLEECVQE